MNACYPLILKVSVKNLHRIMKVWYVTWFDYRGVLHYFLPWHRLSHLQVVNENELF